jgi:prepilin-type N-terminal cleavage/methylation domain-containing protein/prepilin-type processing-associated H-X9-DG protein
MSRSLGTPGRLKGFTLIELLVVVAIIALLISILLPSLSQAKESAKQVKCGTQLKQIGLAMAMCEDEYNGCLPGIDDGAASGSSNIMLTWLDVLYDLNFTGNIDIAFCPTDRRCDEPAQLRGELWGFNFVDKFHVSETPRRGVRTSYAITTTMAYSWPADRYKDSARQVYAAEGWWTWAGNMSAWYVMGPKVGIPVDIDTQNWECNKVAYRHGKNFTANILFCDQHVGPINPRPPKNLQELIQDRMVDTNQAFIWLPGERNSRFDNRQYQGEVQDWVGRWPGMNPDHNNNIWRTNPTRADELDPMYRSGGASTGGNVNPIGPSWKKLPNPNDRW